MAETDNYQLEQTNVLEEFKEVDEIRGIIRNLPNIIGDQIAVEMAAERFLFVIDLYQEQPHLLDSHLESLLNQLLEIAKNDKASPDVVHLAFKFLYLITKTRGYKVIVRLMPHEVADLEPVLAMIDKQDPTDFQTWETRYMLLLWLSMVSMIPFDMSRLDSTARAQGIEGKKPTMDRILEIGQRYLDVSDKSRDAASYMLSRFLTRVDVKDKKLPEMVDYSLTALNNATCKTMQGTTSLLGQMRTLCLLFKQGKRDDLVSYAPTVLKLVMSSDLSLKTSSNTSVRKLSVKLIQRLGLTFLKARVAAWRYQRGNRSLAENLSRDGNATEKMVTDADEDEEYDIPEELEDVVEQLLIGLKDKDTVVRWSAAKGVGRVLGRLPKELADEVVGSIMELFTITESDTAWHGGCLALAELGRRGLLLPQRLSDVVPVVVKALNYDQKRGNFSVGAHVRDAACYVCWAFARAYDPEEVKPHVQQIASALVIVSVFDREINVRRAASAAFQENVGRQGQFPHGIDILTMCDYFAVGNRMKSYLNLSVYVGQFPEYTKALIDHLVNVKISHWDKTVRLLAAEALHNLTVRAPEYMCEEVVPKLVTMASSIELNLRHGAILSAAFVIHGLAEIGGLKKGLIEDKLRSETISELENITHKLHDAKLFRGIGGELMRESVCCLIKKLSLSHVQFHNKPVIGMWQDLIDDCLQHAEVHIQAAAIDAIPAFFTEYYQTEAGQPEPKIQGVILSKYLGKLHNSVEMVCQGYSLALGALPAFMVQGQLDRVLSGLIQTSTITGKNKKWAEARRDAVKAITSLCLTVGVQKNGRPSNCVCQGNINLVYDSLFSAMNDYTLDSRGDVGAWVREASMTGLHDITSMLVTTDASLLSNNISRTMFCSIVQQACEKIDRTRVHALEIFVKLLHHKPTIDNIPQRDQVCEIFPVLDERVYYFLVPAKTFPRCTELLRLDTYLYPVLLGMTVSVGGLTESLVKSSASSLLSYLQTILDDRPKMDVFTSTLLKIFKDHQKLDRVTLPMFKMLEQLQCNGCFNIYAEENHQFGSDLFSVCKQEVLKSGDPQKLLASIDVFCGLLQFNKEVQKKVVSQLMIYLCHKFPIMRKTSANKLYEAMLTYDDLVTDDNMEEVLAILSETQWDKPISEVKPLRNKLCDLFQVSKPVGKVPAV